jgi:hypothetical protein
MITMKKAVCPKTLIKPTKYERLVGLLCWMKVIPLIRGKNNSCVRFRILSLPTLLSTLWCWIPLSYYIYVYFNWPIMSDDNSNYGNTSLANTNNTVTSPARMALDDYIFIAFQVVDFLLILLLPTALAHFFACTESREQRWFDWSQRAWILVFSVVIFLSTEATSNYLFALQDKATGKPTLTIVHNAAANQLVNVTASLLQLTALLLVSSRQSFFVKKATMNRTLTTCSVVNNLLKDYERVKFGVGPLYALDFCIHTPIILCFAYFGISSQMFIIYLWSSGKIVWSGLTLIHICLMSEDCYDAVQNLLPALRYCTCIIHINNIIK